MDSSQQSHSFLNLMGPHDNLQRYLVMLAGSAPNAVPDSRAFALVNVLATDEREARSHAERLVQARGLVSVAAWPLPEVRDIVRSLEQSILSPTNPAQLNWRDPYVQEMDLESEADTDTPEDDEVNCYEMDDGESYD